MKCIKSNKNGIMRVTNERAEELVKGGSWSYIPKKVWKDAGASPADVLPKATKKTKKASKKKKTVEDVAEVPAEPTAKVENSLPS